jgi:hypothetical protein
MINNLYGKYADYYAAVTADRDFTSQLDCILNSYNPGKPKRTLLELFAGQSLHSIEAVRRDMDSWAIDSSPEMKDRAIFEGFKKVDQYIVGELPDIILEFTDHPKFDCVLCLYHGLSNLTQDQVYLLLRNITQIMNTGGKIFIELHDISEIMSYVANPVVAFSEVYTREGLRLKYAWPGGKISWNAYTYTATVPIQLIIESDEHTEKIELMTEDRIYSTEDIAFIGNLLGYRTRILYGENWKSAFGNSIILELCNTST